MFLAWYIHHFDKGSESEMFSDYQISSPILGNSSQRGLQVIPTLGTVIFLLEVEFISALE